MAEKRLRLLVVDSNAPWTRSLFTAMPAEVEVFSLRVQSAGLGTSATLAAVGKTLRKTRLGPSQWEETRIIPGWAKAYKFSSAVIGRWVRRRAAGGPPGRTWAIYTIPQYAAVAERAKGIQQAYYAYDPYAGYGWDKEAVAAWEWQLLQRCERAIAISRSLQADFASISGDAVGYLPNAVSSTFLERMSQPGHPPADLAAERRFVVGCIGQMNRSYDWQLVEALADRCPTAVLVFIGPIIEREPKIRAEIERILAKPNVRWLGPQPHDALPGYLRRFDVCLNPLMVNAHNNRRSPLRLYDYLATDKPILSTAISEALTHEPHITVAPNAAEMAADVERIRNRTIRVDLEARRRYIAANTWERRAEQLLSLLESNGKA